MRILVKLKTMLMKPLIRMVIKHPKIMETKLFLKAMEVFPEKISSTYDEKVKKSGIDYKASLQEGLRHVKGNPGKILDIGTGTGFAAFLAAERFTDAEIEGVDLSPGMVEVATEKADDGGYSNVRFRTGNAMKMDYPDEAFDMIVTTNAPVYLEEAVRVLKTGGEILIAYSFGGEAFNHGEEDIKKLLKKNRLELQKLKSLNKGVFILGRKEKQLAV